MTTADIYRKELTWGDVTKRLRVKLPSSASRGDFIGITAQHPGTPTHVMSEVLLGGIYESIPEEKEYVDVDVSGTPDVTLTGDGTHTTLQDAIDSCPDGGLISIGAGTYTCTDSVLISSARDGIRIVGAGYDPDGTHTKILIDGEGTERLRCFRIEGSNIFLKNIYFVGQNNVIPIPGQPKSEVGVVHCFGSQGIKISTCQFTCDYTGAACLWVQPSANGKENALVGARFHNLKFYDGHTYGLVVTGAGHPNERWVIDMLVIGCHAKNLSNVTDGSLPPVYNKWVCGFDVSELAHIEDVQIIDCIAENIFHSGFYTEGSFQRWKLLYKNLQTINCMMLYEIPEQDQPNAKQAAYMVSGETIMVGCTDLGTRKFMENSGDCNITMIDCHGDSGLNEEGDLAHEQVGATMIAISPQYTAHYDWSDVTQNGLRMIDCSFKNYRQGFVSSTWDHNAPQYLKNVEFSCDAYGGEGQPVIGEAAMYFLSTGADRPAVIDGVTMKGWAVGLQWTDVMQNPHVRNNTLNGDTPATLYRSPPGTNFGDVESITMEDNDRNICGLVSVGDGRWQKAHHDSVILGQYAGSSFANGDDVIIECTQRSDDICEVRIYKLPAPRPANPDFTFPSGNASGRIGIFMKGDGVISADVNSLEVI